MNTILKRILGASLALAAFSFITPTHVQAQTCVIPPTCESLGYTLTDAECKGRTVIKCPFDLSKVFCVSAAEVGESGECLNVGDILYSDMTCSSKPISGKIAIGVVVSIARGTAVALDGGAAQWSTEYFNVPNLSNNFSAPTADFNGKGNTKIIVDFCKEKGYSCPAAVFAYTYRTIGTQEGDWYLPAGGELKEIYDSKKILDETFSTLGKESFSRSDYWSSTQHNSSYAWGLDFSNGGWGYDYTSSSKKTYNYVVRPVIQF